MSKSLYVLPELRVVVLDLLPGLQVLHATVRNLCVPNPVLIMDLLKRQLEDSLVDLRGEGRGGEGRRGTGGGT